MTEKTSIWILAPLFGCLLFITLYVIAAILYPGGSQANQHAKGFSWLNNYWCNLLDETAINGERNTARPVAIAGMFALCISLGIFWYRFPQQLKLGKYTKTSIQLPGLISISIPVFLFTGDHDVVINLAVAAGLVALIGTYTGLYKCRWYGLFWFGVINLVLIAVNNYLYYTPGLLAYLPVFQKITFVYFITWICFINVKVYKRKAG